MSVEKVRSEAARQFTRFARRRVLFLSALWSFSLIGVVGLGTAFAACVTNNYAVTSSAPPPTGNWTDTSGALWTPGGGFPGCAPNDTAADTNASPTTIIVNSAIPNSIAGLNFNSPGSVIEIDAGGVLTIAGPATIAGGSKIFVNGGQLVIASGGSLSINDSNFQMNAGEIDLQSGSTMTSASASAISLNGTFNSTGGSLEVTSGTLSLSGGGNIAGPITIDAGATLDFPGVVSGNGTLQISGGTLNIGGVTSPKNFSMSAGTLDGPGFLSISGTMNWNGGTITDSSGSGHTELAASGVGNWNGVVGTMVLDSRTFNVYGYVNFNSPPNPLDLEGNAALVVAGTFDIQSDSSITVGGCCGAMVLVTPNGVFQKTGGTGLSEVQAPVNNNSEVFAFSGILDFSGGGVHNGFFYTGATMEFGGNTSFGSNSFVEGPGEIALDFGSIDFGGGDYSVGLTSIFGTDLSVLSPMATDDLTFDSGSMQTTADFLMDGTGTWSSGTISSAGGKFIVASGATLTIDAANGETVLNGAQFENDGTVNYTAVQVVTDHVRGRAHTQLIIPSGANDLAIANSSSFTNNGTFDVQSDQPIKSTVVIIGSEATPPVASKRLQHHGASTESSRRRPARGRPTSIRRSRTTARCSSTPAR
jgi:hypothetical protein